MVLEESAQHARGAESVGKDLASHNGQLAALIVLEALLEH